MPADRRGYDAIVVGLGAMGSATLYHLAKRGQRVLGLEQFTPGHAFGSSHGDSRIIREQYFEHPLYVPLVQRAYELWRELEGLTYRSLLNITGGLMIGPAEGEVVSGTVQSSRENGLPYEVLTPSEVHRRFPAFELRDDLVAAFDPRAGVLDADACNAAHLDLARAAGAEVRREERVTNWVADGEGVRVSTTGGSYDAGQLVLAGGAWTASLVPELRPALTIERQVLAWFEPSELVAYDLQHFPIYCYEFTPGRINFGVGRTFRGVKAGIHHSGDHIERPEDASRAVGEAEVQRLRDTLRPVLPGLARARLRETQVCLYTNTPDQHFLVDWHPRHANVLVSSPCSGHGFKFASVLGEAQADLLTTGKSLFDLSPFGFSRLVSA